jgi:hypothetical protein
MLSDRPRVRSAAAGLLSAYPNNPHSRSFAALCKSPARLRLRGPLCQRGPTDVERLAGGFQCLEAC